MRNGISLRAGGDAEDEALTLRALSRNAHGNERVVTLDGAQALDDPFGLIST